MAQKRKFLIVDSGDESDSVEREQPLLKQQKLIPLNDIIKQLSLLTPIDNRQHCLCWNKECLPKTSIRKKCLRIHDEQYLATSLHPFPECYKLIDARINLNIIEKTYPNARVYQIEELSLDGKDTRIKFRAAPFETICRDYIRDRDECGDKFTNVMEYFPGDEPCPLVLDVDWYNPVDVSHEKLSAAISDVVDALVKFISLSMVHNIWQITRDDVCVSQACTFKGQQPCTSSGRKASFHIKIPKIVFPSINDDLKRFIEYFIIWLYSNRETYSRIPETFFQQTTEALKIIKAYTGEDNDEIRDNIRQQVDNDWSNGYLLVKSCAVDHSVYSRGRAWRVVGVCKPNPKGTPPRFMRPLLITKWWDSRLPLEYRSLDVINALLPPKKIRWEWARVALMMLPSPGNVSIQVPLASDENSDEEDGEDEEEGMDVDYWRWILDITVPPYREEQREDIKQKNETRISRNNQTTINNLNELGDGEGSSYTVDMRTQYWRALKEMQLIALDHKYTSGYFGDISFEEITKLRGELENDLKLNLGDINIIHANDPNTSKWLFNKKNITLDPRFQLRDIDGAVVLLGNIDAHTTIFCPKHPEKHPSAFVDKLPDGRHYLNCSVCGGVGKSILETQSSSMDVDDWDEIQRQLGSQCVQLVNEPYLELDVLLQMQNPNNDTKDRNNSSEQIDVDPGVGISGTKRCTGADKFNHCDCGGSSSKATTSQLIAERENTAENTDRQFFISKQDGKTKIIVAISPMGSGKTTLLRKFVLDPSFLMKITGLSVMEQPCILCITARERLSLFMSCLLGLVDYKSYNGPSSKYRHWLREEHDRFSVCINTLRHMLVRRYHLLIIDEFATLALSFLAKHMQKYVKDTWDALQGFIKNAGIVMLLAADGTLKTVKTLLPDVVDWTNPTNIAITINSGGRGGIWGHQVYMSGDLEQVIAALKDDLTKGKSVYVPTNQRRFAQNLLEYALTELNIPNDQIILMDKCTSEALWQEMLDDPLSVLGFDKDGNINPDKPKILLFIATPAFGVGFSVPKCFDRIIACFFLYPPIPEIAIQQLARFRGVKSGEALVYWQSLSPSRNYQRSGGELEHLKHAVQSYDELIADIHIDYNLIPEGSLRDFAMFRWVQTKRACSLGWWMFVKAMKKTTGKQPLLFESWLCQHGQGPPRELPIVATEELKMLQRRTKLMDDEDIPITREKMLELSVMRSQKIQLSPIQVEYLTLYNHLPVPPGNLKVGERAMSFVKILDNFWIIMEFTMHGGTGTLQHLDRIKRKQSFGVALVDNTERILQRFQVFDLWASMITSGIIEKYPYLEDSSWRGIVLLKYIISQWRNNRGEEFHFDIEVDYSNLLDSIKEYQGKKREYEVNDAILDDWFDNRAINAFVINQHYEYFANIVRKGLRQMFGICNIQVRKLSENSVRVHVTDFRRLVMLACVRFAVLPLEHAVCLTEKAFDIFRPYRDHLWLGDLIPSDDDLIRLCGLSI